MIMPDENDIIYYNYGVDVESIFRAIYNLFTGGAGNADGFISALHTFWQIFSVFAFLLSALLLIGIIYAKIRHAKLVEIEQQQLKDAEAMYARKYAKSSENSRWQEALTHSDSDNPNDWRLAIIEADIVLDELLNKIGLVGLTIGDKLKNANRDTFRTIDDAWQAHKIRNDIAHKGTDYVLTKRTAKEALEKYRRVFEEFSVI